MIKDSKDELDELDEGPNGYFDWLILLNTTQMVVNIITTETQRNKLHLPMKVIKINIIRFQILQTLLHTLSHIIPCIIHGVLACTFVPFSTEFGSEEYLIPFPGPFEPFTDICFGLPIYVGAMEMSI